MNKPVCMLSQASLQTADRKNCSDGVCGRGYHIFQRETESTFCGASLMFTFGLKQQRIIYLLLPKRLSVFQYLFGTNHPYLRMKSFLRNLFVGGFL